MVQSVELLLDADSDARIRAEWGRLLAADLPSQARHTGRSNRPHITLGVTTALTAQQESVLSGLTDPLPLLLGAPLLFGRGPFVVARSVVPTAELLTLQARVIDVLGHTGPFAHQQIAGRWTGHVTLARKVSPADLERALDVLLPLDVIEATAVAVRRWNGDAKVEWVLDPAPPSEPDQARLGN